MVSSDDEEFEVTDARGPSIKRRGPAKLTRKSTRTKLPPIPKVASPPRTNDPSEPSGSGSSSPKATRKRKSPVRKAARSPSLQPDTSHREHDELEEGPKRKYRKPSPKATATKKGKAPAKAKEVKPKKISKAAIEREKLEELRNDEHFGKLNEDVIKRIAKVYLERLYLIHRYRNASQHREEFDVCGSTGNVYKVAVARQVQCSCIDFATRRKVCKHLLFVYIKVLRLPGSLPVYSRVRLSDEDVETIFDEARDDPVAEALAQPDLRKAWEAAVGYKPNSGSEAASGSNLEEAKEDGKRLMPTEGDVCGVCYEDFEPGSTEGLEFCLKSCGRPIHTDCLETWFKTRGFDQTCIWCRAPWHDAHKQGSRSDYAAQGYGIGANARGAVVDESGRQLNLAEAAGIESRTKKAPGRRARSPEDRGRDDDRNDDGGAVPDAADLWD